VLDGDFGKSFEFSPARYRQDGSKDKVEVDHTQKSHTISPQSSADFERIILGSPNSSYAWIRYASFHIQLSDFSQAREILRRALKTIHFREEQERFNIWVALLNLECTFGDDETVESIFQQAIKANDPKRISLRLASIYQQAGVSTVW
jgi:rRNA biogenesis protein RRP5